MAELLEPKLVVEVGCETPTMELLDTLGVPLEEYPYYLGFMKRMIVLYRNFTSETLASEKESLITEYVLRGKDRDVLEAVQIVAEGCAGIVVSCDQVKACLEGDYTTWTKKWDAVIPYEYDPTHFRITITMSDKYIYICCIDSTGFLRFMVLKVEDGSTVFLSGAGSNYFPDAPDFEWTQYFQFNTLMSLSFSSVGSMSIFARYILVNSHADPYNKLDVWKDGTLQWTSPSVATSIVDGEFWVAAFLSTSGKYILCVAVDNHSPRTAYVVLFEGS
jgi:hypothetical protein